VNDLSDGLPAFPVSRIRNAAGVYDEYVSTAARIDPFEQFIGKGPCNSRSLGKIQFASQCLKRYSFLQNEFITVPAAKIAQKS